MAEATLSVGGRGFALVCAWQLVLFAGLGLCWFVLRPADRFWRPWLLVWGRMVRDAAGNCLPFSQAGGFVFGAQALAAQGVSWPAATATTIVDLTGEFLAQIGLILIGVLILAARAPGSSMLLPVSLGLVAALAVGLVFIWMQRGARSPVMALSRRILGSFRDDAALQVATVQQGLAAIYAAPWRVALCTGLHLLCWIGTGFASWLAFRLLGAELDFTGALAIEALLHAVLAAGFLVPGYAGVQEAAYAAVGALFGQPPELSLGVSLLRRARDIALGVPILLLWQAVELRRRRMRAA